MLPNPPQRTLSMMINLQRLSLLLVFIHKATHAQSQCKTSDICKLENTRATSSASSLIPRSSVYPSSCSGLCLQHAKCMATTYDPATERCELHEVYEDGASCISLSAMNGSNFWMMKFTGIPCPKVRYGK